MKKPGGWITGVAIMQEHGVLATEIGQACYDGELHAYAETGQPVLEDTKLPRIPKYPPVGVNPFDHIQYTHIPKWDWSEQVAADNRLLKNSRLQYYIS